MWSNVTKLRRMQIATTEPLFQIGAPGVEHFIALDREPQVGQAVFLVGVRVAIALRRGAVGSTGRAERAAERAKGFARPL